MILNKFHSISTIFLVISTSSFWQNMNNSQKTQPSFFQQPLNIRGQFTLQDYELHGKVKEFSTKHVNIIIGIDTPIDEKNITSYDRTLRFDIGGRLYCDTSNQQTTYIHYRVTDGQPESKTGAENEIYFYDEQNRLTKIENENEIQTFSYNNKNLFESQVTTFKKKIIEDEKSRNQKFSYGSMNLQGIYPLTELVTEREFEHFIDKQTVTCKYNSEGKIIEEKNKNWLMPDYSFSNKTKYNDNGDMIENTQIATDGTQIFTYQYEYDEQNNWTKCTEKRHSSDVIIFRKITYY